MNNQIFQAMIFTGIGWIFFCLAYCKWLDIRNLKKEENK